MQRKAKFLTQAMSPLNWQLQWRAISNPEVKDQLTMEISLGQLLAFSNAVRPHFELLLKRASETTY